MDVKKLILQEFKIRFDELKDGDGQTITIVTYDPTLEISWAKSTKLKKQLKQPISLPSI